MIRYTTVACVLMLGAACARRAPVRSADPVETETTADSVYVEVVNDNYYDVRLHAVYQGGGRYPLGTVAGNRRQAALAIPWHPKPLVVEVALIIGSGVYVSDRVDASAGDVVQIRIPENIETSAFFRRLPR